MAELAPPRKSVELEDPGAHELGRHAVLHFERITCSLDRR